MWAHSLEREEMWAHSLEREQMWTHSLEREEMWAHSLEREEMWAHSLEREEMWAHSLEREEMWPLYFTNINGHIKQILEQHRYSKYYVLNLKRHSGNMFFVKLLDLLRFSCNQCFKKGQ